MAFRVSGVLYRLEESIEVVEKTEEEEVGGLSVSEGILPVAPAAWMLIVEEEVEIAGNEFVGDHLCEKRKVIYSIANEFAFTHCFFYIS